MNTIRIKFVTLVSLLLVFLAAVLYLPHVYFYDHNELFRFMQIENQGAKKNIGIRKNYPLLIDQPIASQDFLTMLYFMKMSGPAGIVIRNDFKQLADNDALPAINQFIKNTSLISGTAPIGSGKGVGLLLGNYAAQKDLTENYLYLQTGNSFYLSHARGDIIGNVTFDFLPDSTSVYADGAPQGSVDLLFKFGKKYSFTLPFLLYLKLNGYQNMERLKFGSSSITIGGQTLYYDERGRISYKGEPALHAAVNYTAYSDWNAIFKLRLELAKNLGKLGLTDNTLTGYAAYMNEEREIDALYTVSDMKNGELAGVLTLAKDQAATWKSYRDTYKEYLADALVFISGQENTEWINKTVQQLFILERGGLLKRIHHRLLFVLSLIVLLLCFAALFAIGDWTGFLLAFTILIINCIFYFIAVNFVGAEYPLSISLIFGIVGGVLAMLMRYIYFQLWRGEVQGILGHTISKELCQEIALQLRDSTTEFKSGIKTATFIRADISSLLENDQTEINFVYMNQLLSKIEALLKKKRGVISSLLPSGVSAYYGVPLNNEDHWQDGVESAQELARLTDDDGELKDALVIALHSKREYFDLIRTDENNRYGSIGSSVTMLDGMCRVAKRFNVRIIVSANVVRLSGTTLKVRMLDRIKVKGVQKSERVFQLFTDAEYADKEKIIDYFHAGLKLFESKMWEEASCYFKQCLKLDPDDEPSVIYLERCKDFVYIPPQEGWDGVYEVE